MKQLGDKQKRLCSADPEGGLYNLREIRCLGAENIHNLAFETVHHPIVEKIFEVVHNVVSQSFVELDQR